MVPHVQNVACRELLLGDHLQGTKNFMELAKSDEQVYWLLQCVVSNYVHADISFMEHS